MPATYDAAKGTYFFYEKHHKNDIFTFYKLSEKPTKEQVEHMLRIAYKGYYCSEAPEDKVAWWVNMFEMTSVLPNSVIGFYYHSNNLAVKSLDRAVTKNYKDRAARS